MGDYVYRDHAIHISQIFTSVEDPQKQTVLGIVAGVPVSILYDSFDLPGNPHQVMDKLVEEYERVMKLRVRVDVDEHREQILEDE